MLPLLILKDNSHIKRVEVTQTDDASGSGCTHSDILCSQLSFYSVSRFKSMRNMAGKPVGADAASL